MIRPWRTKAYKRDVDRTLIRENLKLTTQQRAEKMIAALAFAEEIRRVQQGQPVTDFRRLLEALTHQGVELIVIGGFAAMAHGSAHVTVDLDIVYRRTPENMSRLAAALAPLQPYLRGAPPGLPFRFDVETIKRRALWLAGAIRRSRSIDSPQASSRASQGPRAQSRSWRRSCRNATPSRIDYAAR